MSRNEMAICPFDPQHTVSACRLQYHIVKCKKKHGEITKSMKTCPFNARHRMSAMELKDHVLKCPDKELMIKDNLSSRPAKELINRAHNYVPSYIDSSESFRSVDDWELDDGSVDDSSSQCPTSASSFSIGLSHVSDIPVSIGHGISSRHEEFEEMVNNFSKGVGIGRATYRKK